MRLIQFLDDDGARAVGITAPGEPAQVPGIASVRELALEAIGSGQTLAEVVAAKGQGAALDYARIVAENRLLLPLDHPDPARCIISITGLTHLGSAESRAAMHASLKSPELTDSMRMFKSGLEGGRPDAGAIGAQPEWAYKGDGSWAVPPGATLEMPAYSEDSGEEAELVALYVIGADGGVYRVGFCLGNELSDHVMERGNYLNLAHSKLRHCSYGPELLVGPMPAAMSAEVRITRDGASLWIGTALSGDENMSHSIENLEHHHFKYDGFRRPGDVHVCFLGASILSFASGVTLAAGDDIEIESALFGEPLRNRLVAGIDRGRVDVRQL